MNSKFITYLICSLFLLIPFGMQAKNDKALISNAELTNRNIVMGDTTTMRLELVQPKDMILMAGLEVKDSISSVVELGDLIACDTTDLGNNRIQIKATYIVQAFDSGEWHLNPVLLIEPDTIRCDIPLVIKVNPIKVDPNGDIKDFAPVLGPERKLLDYVPDWVTSLWWVWVLLLIAATLVYAYFKWWRKGKNPLKRVKKRKPPYEEAVERLNLLKSKQLWQNGREKDYYTGLTDILREYIDRRFGINAIEMTSSEIIDALKNNSETQLVNDQLSEILAIADFVKFAGQRPLADDNERSFQRAVNFVDATKPLPENEKASKEKEGKK
ncbi:MAG: cell wall anchor protein [Muribaculaceae bacterium]|nr:cell wall anchor protein [Muribaculaceae bacterium]